VQLFKNKRSSNWQVRYVDEDGRRRDVSSGTSNRKLAQEYGDKLEREALMVRQGLLEREQLARRSHARRPLAEHLDDYLSWCRSDGQAADALRTKVRDIERMASATGCTHLGDLTASRLVRHMDTVAAAGRAPRTVNRVRCNVRAFLNWCQDYGRIDSHDINKRTVPKRNEALDCRRKRRALTDAEEHKLRAASLVSGRWWTYQLVLWTGLRRNELKALRWADVDVEEAVLHVRAATAKARRDDDLPLAPQALEALEALRRLCPESCERVVPRVPADETMYADLERAGVQGRTATGSCATNANGERVDFHALRTTFATRLAHAGVAPQVLKRLMRHRNIATTDRHYIGLRTTDLGVHLGRVAEQLSGTVGLAATGTDGPEITSHKTSHNAQRHGRIPADAGGHPTRAGRIGWGAEMPWKSCEHGHARTPADARGLDSETHGPVAQRTTGNRANPAGNGAIASRLPTKVPISRQAAGASGTDLVRRVAGLLAILSPDELEVARKLLGAR